MFDNKTLAALLALATGHAAVAADPVTTGETVVVTATRSAIPLSRVLADVTVLGHEEIEQSGSLTLPELLSRQPGVEAYSNGGEGKSASLLLRGAKADHVLVLVDGMRIASVTTGATSLEHLPLAAIEKIEILRGPASSLYGADAIGGVIQIFTKRGEGGPALSFHAGIGAEHKRSSGAGLSGKAGNTAFNLALEHNRTDGISSRRYLPGKYNPDRDGYENTTYLVSVQHELAAGHSLGLNLYQTEASSAYDATVNKADELRSRLQGHSIELKNRLRANWQSTLRYAETNDRQHTFTKGNFGTPSAIAATRQQEWQWQHDVQWQGVGQFSLGAAHTEQQIETLNSFNGTRRNVDSLFAAYQGSFGAHRLQGSLRHDDNSQFGDKATGQLGYGYALTPQWLLGAAYGTAFKAPTFNQLYWSGSGASYHGNPALRPEEARNRELSLKWRQQGDYFSVIAFDNRIDNLIASKSASDGLQVNIDEARITGQTLEAGRSWGDFSLAGSITSQRPRSQPSGKLLARHAKLFGALTAGWQLNRARLSAEWRASGRRYDDADNSADKVLGGYGVLNLGADYQLDKQWTLNTRLSNVGDKRYETVKDYNQPRRGWFVGVRYAQ